MDVLDVAGIVLDRFAARDDQDGTREREHRSMTLTVLLYLRDELRMVAEQAGVDDSDETGWRLVSAARDNVSQKQVGRVQYSGGEVHRIFEIDADYLSDVVHVT